MWSCTVDVREHKLLEVWDASAVPCDTRALDIGDVCFFKDGTPKMILERKTNADLEASLHDGRWAEQKARILANRGDAIVIYALEGRALSEPWYFTVTMAMQVRDGICVVCTPDCGGTVGLVQKLWEKLREGAWEASNVAEFSCAPRAMKKADNYSPIEIWKSQVACIPRVSLAMARKIVDAYPSLQDFQTKATLEDLTALPVTEKKKLGPKLAKTLMDYFA
jgi:ERCC4-type nuclease